MYGNVLKTVKYGRMDFIENAVNYRGINLLENLLASVSWSHSFRMTAVFFRCRSGTGAGAAGTGAGTCTGGDGKGMLFSNIDMTNTQSLCDQKILYHVTSAPMKRNL